MQDASFPPLLAMLCIAFCMLSHTIHECQLGFKQHFLMLLFITAQETLRCHSQ